MDEEKLRGIIQKMIANNEPPSKIREVVRRAKEMMAAQPSKEQVIQSVEQGEIEESPSIDLEELKRVSEAVKKKTNGNEDFQMNEDQLNSPIGQDESYDIFSINKPQEVEMVADQVINKPFDDSVEMQLIEKGKSSAVEKLEQDYAQDFIDTKGYHDYTSPDYLRPKADEVRANLENITIDSPEVKESVLAETVGVYDDYDFGNQGLKDLNLLASTEDIKKAKDEWKKGKDGIFVNMKDEDAQALQEDKYFNSLVDKDDSGGISINKGWKSPKDQLESILSWETKPYWYPQEKWDIVKKYKEDGGVSNEMIDNADPRLVNKTIQAKKQNSLTNFFYDNDDLSSIERTKISALLADQIYGKLTYDDVMRMDANPELLKLEMEKNQQRQSSLIKDMNNIKAKQNELEGNEEYQKLNKEAKRITDELTRLQESGINENSSQAEIDNYNNLLSEYKALQVTYDQKGFKSIREQQAKDIEAWESKNAALADDAAELGDVSLALDLATKNYSALDKTKLQMEKFFLGNAFAGTIGATSGFIAEGLDIIGGSASMGELSDFLHKVEGVAIDYNKSIDNQMGQLAPTLKLDDVSFKTLDSYIAHTLAENSPSIATVMLTMRGGKMAAGKNASTAVRMQAAARASKIAQGIFFSTSYGGKGMELAIAQKNAPGRIKKLQEQIDSGVLSGYEKQQAEKRINELEDVLDLNVLQKAGSSLLSGAIDMYSEKLGSLGYMKNLNRIKAAVDAKPFKKLMYQGLNSLKGAATEVVEEAAAQIGNNLSDIYILGEDKSIVDGIDADFLAKTAISSFAMQGPSVGSNLYSMFKSEMMDPTSIRNNKKLFDELIDIEETLQSPLTTDANQKKELRKRKKEIIEVAGMKDIMSVQKLARMSTQEKSDLFELNRRRRRIIKNLRELGGRSEAGSKSIKKQKDRLVKEFKEVDTQRNELLSKKQRKIQEEYKEAADPALGAYNQGLYDFYSDIVGAQQEINGNKYIEVNNETTVDNLKEQFGEDKANELIEARNKGNNATFVGNDIIIFPQNVKQNLMSTRNKSAAMFAAVSPLHELMHIENRRQGIVKNGKVVGDANKAIQQAESVIKENLATGRITQEQYDDFLARKKQYTDETGVDVEEMLNLFGDMTATGILSESDFSKINGLQYMLKGLVRKFAGPNISFLFPLKTGADVFSYIKSFKDSVEKSELKSAPPEDISEDLKFSQAASNKVQDIFNEQGEAGAFDIIEEFKPIVNKIVQRRSEAPGFDRQLLTDEIETGKRGILDLIREYDPESGVPLAAYINKFLPARAIEASKRVLGEQFEDDVTEVRGLEAEDKTGEVDNSPISKTERLFKLKNRLTGNLESAINKVRSQVSSLPIADLDFKSLRNIALQEVQELFGIKPKPGNLTKDDVRNAQQYINKNAEALITMLPEGSTPGGTSTGVQKVLLDNFYEKQDRVKMLKTGSKAGLAPYQKRNNITPSEFKEVFGITPAGTPNVSDRNTSARIKALVSQTERMLTNQEVREALQEQGIPVPSRLSEGKSELMFSQGQKLTKKEQKAIEAQRKLLDSDIGTQLLAEQKDWKQIIKDYGMSPINLKTAQGRESYRQWIANVLAPKLPANFFTVNAAGVLTGKTEAVRDENNNKTDQRTYAGNYAFLSKKEVVDFIEQAIADGVVFSESEIPGLKRASYAKLDKRFSTKEFKQQQKDKIKGFKQVLDVFNSLIQENTKANAPFVAALMSSTSAYQGHFMRTSSPIGFTNFTGLKQVEEHTEPASDLGKFLLNRMIQGNYELYIDGALENFFQGLLPDVYDKMLKGIGPDGKPFNYTQNAPEKYMYDILMGAKSIWLRYFNPQVNGQIRVDENGVSRRGIDPNVLVEINGKSVAENNNLGLPKNKLTPNVIAKQQDLLFKVLDNQISKEDARKQLDEYTKLAPDMLKASKGTQQELSEAEVLYINQNMTTQELLSKAISIDNALNEARKLNPEIKKIRVFDFDDTIATSKSLVFYTKADGTEGQLTAEEFAKDGARLVEEGAVMDFSDFNIVRNGKRGPMFNVAKKIKEARGNEDLFILTARAPQAQKAIYEFLKSEGLEFKMDNIIGLGNSTPQAKANWLLDKAADGYNDFYFADDALKNVKEVKQVMDVVDVKSKVQQAKLKFSKGVNEQFNSILDKKAVELAGQEISAIKAKTIGSSKGNFKFWIPYSAEDFMGLIYPTLSKGLLGDNQMAWYKKHLITPYARAMSSMRTARLQMMNDFRALKKKLDVPIDLPKVNASGFTNEQSVRVYLYNKMGYDIPGASKKDIQEMIKAVESNAKLTVFANELLQVTKGDGWAKPKSDWLAGTVTTDLLEVLNTTKRQKYLQQFNENANAIYSEQNLNKLEAIYGPKYREALENMLSRMKSGKNRTGNNNRLSNKILNYINGSNAAVMFFNTRSAVLQTISAINFVNWSFNNPLKAGQAFANQTQYWSDFMKLMNSEYLRDRRSGLRININENEIANAAKTAKNKAKGAMAYILEKGYLPTQMADSFAIAAGGATFYRNRIKDLVSKGMTEAQAEKQAMQEFVEISEESQQSSRPDRISQQQSSDVGRLILMFANTPMQYARIQKRAAQDLINGRGDWKSNISKIAYYGFVQNLIFNALQQAVFALGFGDDDEEKDSKKTINTLNGMIDSTLRGLGIGGAMVSVVKNLLLDVYERSKRPRPEYVDSVWKLLQFSPPISSKISKLRQAAWHFNSKKRREEMKEKGFSIDNPAYEAAAKVVSATTNIPLDRVLNKYNNIEDAMQEETEWWQKVALILGWSKWQLEDKKYESKNKKQKKKESRLERRSGSRLEKINESRLER